MVVTDYAQELTVRPPFMQIKIESYATVSTEKANLPGVVQMIDKLEEIRLLLTETLDSNQTKGDYLNYYFYVRISSQDSRVLKVWNLPEDNNHLFSDIHLNYSDLKVNLLSLRNMQNMCKKLQTLIIILNNLLKPKVNTINSGAY